MRNLTDKQLLMQYQGVGMIVEDQWMDSGQFSATDDLLVEDFKIKLEINIQVLVDLEEKIVERGFATVDFINGKRLPKYPRKMKKQKKTPLFAQAFQFLYQKGVI